MRRQPSAAASIARSRCVWRDPSLRSVWSALTVLHACGGSLRPPPALPDPAECGGTITWFGRSDATVLHACGSNEPLASKVIPSGKNSRWNRWHCSSEVCTQRSAARGRTRSANARDGVHVEFLELRGAVRCGPRSSGSRPRS
jgi:hypothetical protein